MTSKINVENALGISKISTEMLRDTRTSIKWANCETDVLPMFIAEMDFTVDQRITSALIEQIQRSDLGYAEDLTELVAAFSSFAQKRWGWSPDQKSFFGAPDVSFGVKAALRHFVPKGGRVALTTPVYPSFFNYLQDLELECVEIPLVGEGEQMRIDTDALAAAFNAPGDQRVHALILSNPHNPHGIAHSKKGLEALAVASQQSGALIISDEIHAPLVHEPTEFNPFAPIAAEHGATSVVVTSASKGWNVAGTKCAFVYAPPEIAPDSFREYLSVSLGYSVSILGRTANTVAFGECEDWLDAAIKQVKENSLELVNLLKEHVPGAKYTPPQSSYLAWIDLREAGLGDAPAQTILQKARVNVSDGAGFGENGAGFIRLNMGCTPELLRDAIRRIGEATVPTHKD